MANPSVMGAFTIPIVVRRFRIDPPHWLQRRKQSRGGSFLLMLRPHVGESAWPVPAGGSAPLTGPPVYSRACPNQGLPQPESAITTRLNHPLPRQDLHLQACQRPKAAHRNLLLTLRGSIPHSPDEFIASVRRVRMFNCAG